MLSNHLIFCHPFLLLTSIFPSIRVFSKELALWISWSEYWSFSFSICPSKEYSGLISLRIDWFDLLAVPTLQTRKWGAGGSSVLIWPLCMQLESVRTGIQSQGPNFKAKLPPLYPRGHAGPVWVSLALCDPCCRHLTPRCPGECCGGCQGRPEGNLAQCLHCLSIL